MHIALLTLLCGLFCLPASVSLCIRPLLCSMAVSPHTHGATYGAGPH